MTGQGWSEQNQAGSHFRVDPSAMAAEVLERRERRNSAFAYAASHSRRVRLLKRMIPAVCIGGLLAGGLYLGSGVLRTPGQTISLDAVGLSGSKITMQAPKLSGFKTDSRAYQVTADAAAQDLKKPNLVELKAPVARLELEENGWARLSAGSGVFDSKTERFEAQREVRVETNNGMDARLKDARVDFKSGTVETDAPVTVTMPQGSIAAETMRVLDNGRRVVFEGNVRSLLNGAADAPAASPAESLRGARP